MARAARYGDGWMPYFYDAARYADSVQKIKAYAAAAGRDMTNFQWTHFPYISIYPTEQQAAEVAAEQLGGRYLYGGKFFGHRTQILSSGYRRKLHPPTAGVHRRRCTAYNFQYQLSSRRPVTAY
ncbi:MAG: hypothetical protein CM1200mP22_31930 [Dehalococcoidia bacterium]|nr:MAG: hypothetical protein CM1200mP22_31930 [Dehalococcoidia bacterium]